MKVDLCDLCQRPRAEHPTKACATFRATLTRLSRGPVAAVDRLRDILGDPKAIAWDFTGNDDYR